MDLCVIDWGLALKFLPLATPIISIFLAFFVYSIWHSQKGKEVIATHSKETIKELLQEYAVLTQLIHSDFASSKETLNSELYSEYRTLKSNNLSNIHYFLNCIKDDELYKHSDVYADEDFELWELISKFIYKNNSETFESDLKILREKYEKFGLNLFLLVDTMRPYSIYKTKYKFIK